MKSLKQLLWFVALTAVIFNSCSSGGARNTSTEKVTQPVNVKVKEIKLAEEAGFSSFIGTIEESQSVPFGFTVPGTVEKVLTDEGQAVKKGKLLAVLNNRTYLDSWKIASAKADQAQDAYNRLEPVYKKGSLPEVKYVEVKTGLEQARSMASIAAKNLEDCNLYAPIDGIIGRKMIEPGMNVIPGSPAFNLVNIEKVKVKIPVPENEIAGIRKGQKVVVRISAIGDTLFEGEVEEIGVLSNPLSHTYMIKAVLDNSENLLKPGMVCDVNIDSHEMTNRIIIPLSAVQHDGKGKKFVFTANPETQRARKITVEAGPLAGTGVVIKNGLTEGDLLITEGYQKLTENSIIQIRN